jgi:uncharacterized membrane protein YjjP (DUF1212 family)
MVNPFKPQVLTINGAKLPLDYEALRDVIDLSLWAGQLLLQFGAETQLVEETIHRLGTGLGCDWMDILVSPNAVVITTISGLDFRTKVRRVVHMSVNMTVLTEINTLTRHVVDGEMNRFELRRELRRISDLPRHYNRWLVVVMVGLACGAFSRLFGGDWMVFGITTFASSAAMFVRQELQHRNFNPLLVTIATAFVAGLLACFAPLLRLGTQPTLALASSVLLLVPGVPLINSAEDLIKGHLVTGIVRGVTGGLISMCIALGLVIAMSLMGVSGL